MRKLSSEHGVLSGSLSLLKHGIKAKINTREMENEEDINTASTTCIRQDVGEKHRKGRKKHNKNEELLSNPTPSEALTSHSPLPTEASDDEHDDELPKNIMLGIRLTR